MPQYRAMPKRPRGHEREPGECDCGRPADHRHNSTIANCCARCYALLHRQDRDSYSAIGKDVTSMTNDYTGLEFGAIDGRGSFELPPTRLDEYPETPPLSLPYKTLRRIRRSQVIPCDQCQKKTSPCSKSASLTSKHALQPSKTP